jgi:replication initiation and membrane attachment protein
MNIMDMNLEEIYRARLKLEGMGLLKTFIKHSEEKRTYLYELQPPLSAEQFFTDGMLNIYLYQKLGHSQFLKLKNIFLENAVKTDDYQDITRSFQDVFTSLNVETLKNSNGQTASAPEPDAVFIGRKTADPIQISGHDFDFDLLLAGLTAAMVPRKAFTPAVKETIRKLSFLYSINEVDMQKIILSSMTADESIDIDELRKWARDWYQMENGDQLPQLANRLQPPALRESDGPKDSKESKLVHYLETTSPRQLLIDLSGGALPAMSDLTAIEDIMFNQQLEPGVMNVLIHYVMLKTDMKLTKNYMEKIASHWARKKIKTVKEAMELAKNEHRQYQAWASGKKAGEDRRKKPIRTEMLPDWFLDETERPPDTLTGAQAEDLEERRRRLEAIQRKYQKQGGEKGGAHQ